jgi:hypothetical protein
MREILVAAFAQSVTTESSLNETFGGDLQKASPPTDGRGIGSRRCPLLGGNVLQNSFFIVDYKIFGPWARFSYNNVGAQLISRLTHRWLR